jgi:hypothetical protein
MNPQEITQNKNILRDIFFDNCIVSYSDFLDMFSVDTHIWVSARQLKELSKNGFRIVTIAAEKDVDDLAVLTLDLKKVL